MRYIVIAGLTIVVIAAILVSQNYSGSDSSDERAYLHDGREFKKNEIEFLLPKFVEKGVAGVIANNGKISVFKKDIQKCYAVISSADFENFDASQSEQKSFLPRSLMTPSEQQRLAKKEKISKLQSIILRSPGIQDVEIVYDQVKDSSFRRELIHSAVVTLTSADGHVISRSDASTVRRVVAKAFAGMVEKDVLVVVDLYTYPYFDGVAETEREKNLVLNQLDLETTRKKYVSQVQKLVAEFGDSKVAVQIELAKKSQPVSNAPIVPTIEIDKPDAIQALINGTGKIEPKTKSTTTTPPPARHEIVTEKRLFGIEVTIETDVVRRYLQRNMGIVRQSSDEQFSRGVTAIRNEITKKTISWVRNQGVDFSPDLVSVIVTPNQQDSPVESATEISEGNNEKLLYTAMGVICFLLFVGGALAIKLRNPANPISQRNRETFSESGRRFVSRNQATTGSVLIDEIQEAVNNDPQTSIQAFQNLVRGDANG